MQGIQARGRYGAFLGTVLFIAAACSGGGATTAPATAAATTAAASPSSGVASTQPSPASAKWDEVLAAAKGQTVNWYMWGGDETINKLVTGYVKDEAAKLGVTLNQVPISDTVDAVNKVVGEKSAGKNEGGSVDLIWINGENFATMKQGDLLQCGWVHDLPNDQYIDWKNPTVNTDFGLPVGDCEAPWSLAQMASSSPPAAEPPMPARTKRRGRLTEIAGSARSSVAARHCRGNSARAPRAS